MKQLVLPFRGELGMKLRYHVPAVHAMAPDVVCMEGGEEALYPTAVNKLSVARNTDIARRDRYSRDRAFVTRTAAQLAEVYPRHQFVEAHQGSRESWFTPEPVVRVGLRPDVVVCPRWREYGPSKNWPSWTLCTKAIQAEGLSVLAGGAPDSSASVGCDAAWEYTRFLDATIEAMLAAKVVVATDAGLSLLAMLCGRPLVLVVTRDMKCAPGPVIDVVGGHVYHKEYWPIRMGAYYAPMNHRNAPIHVVAGGWEDPSLVHAAVLKAVTYPAPTTDS